MGRPRMNVLLPRYASEFVDNRGKARVRLRRTGWQTIYVQAAPGTPEFTEAYRTWERTGKREIGQDRIQPGTFDDLIARFYRSPTWEGLKPTTRETYRGELERFRAQYGNRSASTMMARHVSALLMGMKETPAAANNLLKRLRQLFDYAIHLNWRVDNPAKSVRPLKTRKGGFKTWQEEQIEQFEAAHPIGTMPRLAFDLALYTAQRKSDVRLMGPQHITDGRIAVKQIKTGKELKIKVHPKLAASIRATAVRDLVFIVSAKGKPFSYDSFGMWFMRQCRKAGLEGYSMHGLRKAASRRMAELGLSNQMIKSITGHTSDTEVARYTRDAEQVSMADTAVDRLASGDNPDLASKSQTAESKG
ncbi:MAG: hypothetical protein B7X92_10370 [Novosphingobium sp. 17-62-9]|nr:MAG: hypothetical protein B7X92_10370 [Novosphingobium sp. 17-62-9]